MIKILWVGSFLSKHRGSKGVSEVLAEQLFSTGIESQLVSKYDNKVLRLLHIVIVCFTSQAKIFHIDVFSGSAFQIARIAVLIAKFRQRKIVMTLHGGKLQEFEIENSNQVKKILAKAHHLQTPSLFLQKHFLTKNINVDYLPNSISTKHFPYNRNEIKPFSILWVRGFMPVYNPLLAINILIEVRKSFPQATLTMIGPDKGLLNETKKYATGLNCIDAVKFEGAIQNELLHKYYQTHQVYVNTTSYESFGVALVEAASCGIPIVSTDVGEIPYLWQHNKNILLVNNFSALEFAKHIENVFLNPQLAESISKSANDNVQLFYWEKIKPHWIKLFTKMNEKRE
jgi:L-malate glycosyltransferase